MKSDEVRRLEEALAGSSVGFAAVALDGLAFERAASEFGLLTGPILIPTGEREAQALGVNRVPMVVALDPSGVVTDTWLGEVDGDRRRQVLHTVLEDSVSGNGLEPSSGERSQ